MAEKASRKEKGVRPMTQDEGWKLFDRAARRYLCMSGAAFRRAWKAKKFDTMIDDPAYHTKIVHVAMLMPVSTETHPGNGRQNPA